MGEVRRIVTFSAGGRPVEVLDLENGSTFETLADTVEITAPPPTPVMARRVRRYGGSVQVAESHDNGEWKAAWKVSGTTTDAALTNLSTLLQRINEIAAIRGRFLEWRPEGATYSTFFELVGSGVWSPRYKWLELKAARPFMVAEIAFPCAPLARMARMDILDTFDVPQDAELLYTNLVTNPSFEVDTAGWSTTASGYWFNAGGVIARFAGGTSAGDFYADCNMPNTAVNANGVAFTANGTWVAGQPYTFSMLLYHQGGSQDIQMFAGDASANSASAPITVAGGGVWTRYSVTWTPSVTYTGNAFFGIRNLNGVGVGSQKGMNAAMVVAGTSTAYFDGDQDKARWTGTAHASTSELYDRSTLEDWTFDVGSGTLAAASGQLTPTTTAAKVLYHSGRGYTYDDVQVTVKVTTASIGGGGVWVIAKRLDANNFLTGYLDLGGAGLTIYKYDGGSFTSLGGVAAVPAALTSYWVRFRIEGNVLTAEWFASTPTPASAPTGSASHTLSGANSTKFGAGISGQVGLRLDSAVLGTRYDDFTVEPFTYRNRTLPEVIPLGGTIPGDAPALVDAEFTPSGGSAAPVWALLGWSERPTVFNQVWNGDFEDDTNGWSVGAVSNIVVAASSINRVTTAAKYGTASGEVVTPATQFSGAAFRVFGRFRKGVTYTVEAWVRSAAQTTLVSIRLGNGAAPDVGASGNTALSAAWQRITTTWVPTADREDAHLGIRVEAATATTFQIDGAQVYEGTVAPTLSSETEGRGGLPPFGIVPAESCDTGDLSGWAISADANYRHGQGLKVTAAGAGTAAAMWFIDPALLAADEFTLQELDVEVFAKVDLASTLVSPKLNISCRPEAGTNFGQERFTGEWQSGGRLLTKPSAGSVFRTVRLGILTLVCDPDRPVRWKLRAAASWAVGSTGNYGLDELYLVPVRKRAANPTGIANGSSYPKFVASTAETTKTVRSDLSGLAAKPPANPFPDSGLDGMTQLELPPGNVDVLVKLASTVPDDPTSDTTSEQKEHSGTVHVSVWPRVHLLRGS